MRIIVDNARIKPIMQKNETHEEVTTTRIINAEISAVTTMTNENMSITCSNYPKSSLIRLVFLATARSMTPETKLKTKLKIKKGHREKVMQSSALHTLNNDYKSSLEQPGNSRHSLRNMILSNRS